MTLFATYVEPKIADAENYLRNISISIDYALKRDDFARVRRLADLALAAQDRLVLLRACEGQPDSVISWHLATI
jgi:hypothetical protein